MSLSLPASASALSAAPSHTAARRARRVSLEPGLPRRSAAPSSSGGRRPRQRARARCRRRQRAVAPADVGVVRRTFGEAVLGGELSRPEPGSVIATKLAPSRSSEQKCANSDSGSIVPPDFEETMNSVRRDRSRARSRGSRPRRSSRARAGRGRRRGARRTSGAAPRGRARSRPCRAARRPLVLVADLRGEQLERVRARSSMRSAIVSHPRRSAISGVPEDPTAWRRRGAARRHLLRRRPLDLAPPRRPERVGNTGLDGQVVIAHARIVVGFGAGG